MDPGFSGALGVVDRVQNRIVACYDMPLLPKNPRDPKPYLDLEKLSFLVSMYSADLDFAVVEDVSAMPGQGVVSMFRFGFTLGAILGVLHSHSIKVVKIKPSVWKPQLGLSRDKEDSIRLVKELFPKDVQHFTLKKHDGRAEACLLANFGASRLHL